jgi:hypothetical protein
MEKVLLPASDVLEEEIGPVTSQPQIQEHSQTLVHKYIKFQNYTVFYISGFSYHSLFHL